MPKYDLIIIGAGPAGMALAYGLSGSGLKILLLDKKKNAQDVSYNTSGSFIDYKKFRLPREVYHPITAAYFGSANNHVVKKGRLCVIDRKKLLEYLEGEAKANPNLNIVYEAKIEKILAEEGCITSIAYSKNGKLFQAAATLYADCSGISAVLKSEMSWPSPQASVACGVEYLVPLKQYPDTVDIFVGSHFTGGYGWIFPKDSKTAIVGFGTLTEENFSQTEANLKNMWKIKRVTERCDLKIIEKKSRR